MKSIKVAAAIIKSVNEQGQTVIFATQRGYGEYKDWWEFPGGKVEEGETSEEALVREIREELDACVTVEQLLITVEYDYPAFHLSMDCFWCSLKEAHLTLLEHEAAKWLPVDDLRQVNWLPADIRVLEAIEEDLREDSKAELLQKGPEMFKIYGSKLCPDCRACVANFDEYGIAYTFIDINESLRNLKEFLYLRDTLPVFDYWKSIGDIGLPAIVREDGSVFVSWETYLKELGKEVHWPAE